MLPKSQANGNDLNFFSKKQLKTLLNSKITLQLALSTHFDDVDYVVILLAYVYLSYVHTYTHK